MGKSALIRFMEKAVVSEELQRDLVALAEKHGIDLLEKPLPDGELDKVVGGLTAAEVNNAADDEYEKDKKGGDHYTSIRSALQSFLEKTYEIKVSVDKW